MTAQIVSLKRPLRWSRDWSQQELAEFYRVESALIQAGLSLETDRGLSDEGDPWFVFCRSDSGEVFIHFARLDGEYVIDGGPFEQVVRGPNFPALVRDLIGRQPLSQAKARGKSNVFFHPAALLIALVGGAFFHSGEAKAAESAAEHPRPDLRRQLILILSGALETGSGSAIEAAQATAILTGVMIGLNQQGVLRAPLLIGRAFTSTVIAPPPMMVLDTHTAQASNTPAAAAQQGSPSPETGGTGPQLTALIAPLKDVLTQGSTTAGAGMTVAPPVFLTPHHDLLPIQQIGASTPLPSINQADLAATSNTEAAQLVQSVEETANINMGSTPRFLKVPDSLASVIQQGRHIDADATSPNATEVAAGSTLGAGTHSGGVVSTAATGGAAPALAASSPPALSSASAPTTPALLDPHDPAVIAAVDTFVGEIQTTDVVMSGHDVVIYDGAILNSKVYAPLDSITFHFNDGSSLSLVGTVVEIYALHYGS